MPELVYDDELREAMSIINKSIQLNPQLAYLLAEQIKVIHEALADEEWIVYYP